MIDYSKLSNHELDLYLGEMLCPNADIVVDDCQRIFMDEEPFDYEEWEPTDPNSNQLRRYVFPKLRELGARVSVAETEGGSSAALVVVVKRGKERLAIQRHRYFDEDENRFTAIACLIAWDKMADK